MSMLAWLRVKSRMSAKARVVAIDDKKFVIGHLHSRRLPAILRLWRDFTSPANGRCWPVSDLRATIACRPEPDGRPCRKRTLNRCHEQASDYHEAICCTRLGPAPWADSGE